MVSYNHRGFATAERYAKFSYKGFEVSMTERGGAQVCVFKAPFDSWKDMVYEASCVEDAIIWIDSETA